MRTLVYLLIVLACCCTMARAEAAAPRSPEDIFDATRVHVIHLRISAEGWKIMQPGAAMPRRSKRTPATAQAVVDGDVRLRTGEPRARDAYVGGENEFDGERVADLG